MRRGFSFMLLLGGLLAGLLPGCGPRLQDDELGQILYEIPQVPGAEKAVEVKTWPEPEPPLGPDAPPPELDNGRGS